MLNRSKLMHELELLADSLFIDSSEQIILAQDVWKKIVNDQTFVYKVRHVEAPWPIPSWTEQLDRSISINANLSSYQVISVDGSQIYPDRHQGMSCCLINIGSVIFNYTQSGKPVIFNSIPYVLGGNQIIQEELELSVEVINCRRQELELQKGLDLIRDMKIDQSDIPSILLYDGSLIFWHLEAKDHVLKDYFLPRYLAILHQLHQENSITASYVSLPKSKELVNLIRLSLCDFDPKKTELFKGVDTIVDATVAKFFLKPFERSIVFKNHAKISEHYLDHIHPHFFYLHVGTEIGRVEIPAWVAQDQKKIDLVAQVILDQCTKGQGYPIAIAEAHEQAVVKGPDRDFFYHVLCKISMERKTRLTLSQKLIKKRGIGI